jgi:hypothetical protein
MCPLPQVGRVDRLLEPHRYSEYGQPLQYSMPITGDTAVVKLSYDDQTRALTDVLTETANATAPIDELSYSYANGTVSKGAGLLMSTLDRAAGPSPTSNASPTTTPHAWWAPRPRSTAAPPHRVPAPHPRSVGPTRTGRPGPTTPPATAPPRSTTTSPGTPPPTPRPRTTTPPPARPSPTP